MTRRAQPGRSRATPPLLTVFIAAHLAACATIHAEIGAPLPAGIVTEWAEPVHYAALLEALGPPSRISALPSGSVFVYQHAEIRERQWGLILPGDIGKFFKSVVSKSTAVTDVALFAFDEEGMLTGRAIDRLKSDPGGGFAFTLIFKLKSLTDSREYTYSQQGVLDWGMAALQTLPVGLNVAQSLDSGASGLDIVRLEGIMGQRALELNRQSQARE